MFRQLLCALKKILIFRSINHLKNAKFFKIFQSFLNAFILIKNYKKNIVISLSRNLNIYYKCT